MKRRPTERTPEAVAAATRLGTLWSSFAQSDESTHVGYVLDILDVLEAIAASATGSTVRARTYSRMAVSTYQNT